MSSLMSGSITLYLILFYGSIAFLFDTFAIPKTKRDRIDFFGVIVAGLRKVNVATSRSESGLAQVDSGIVVLTHV